MNEEAYCSGSSTDLWIRSDWIWYPELRMRSMNVWDMTEGQDSQGVRDGVKDMAKNFHFEEGGVASQGMISSSSSSSPVEALSTILSISPLTTMSPRSSITGAAGLFSTTLTPGPSLLTS